MLEGTVANVPPQGGRKHPEQQYIQIDTTQHPVHLRRHVRRPRRHHRASGSASKTIGFGSDSRSIETTSDRGELLGAGAAATT